MNKLHIILLTSRESYIKRHLPGEDVLFAVPNSMPIQDEIW